MTRRGWILFIAMSVLWGIPYLMIKVAVDELSPATLVFGRTAIGAALLLPIAIHRDFLRPVLRRWRPLLAFTVIEVCLPWLLLGYAEQRVSSSLTGLLIAAVPLTGALLVTLGGDDRLDSRRVLGLLVGFAGVVTLVGFDVEAGNLWAVAAIAGVVIGYAVGPIILSRYLGGLPGLGVIALALTGAALVYTPIAAVQWPSTAPRATVVWSVIGLGVLCTALAFVLFYQLIAEVGPARATVITYVNPAVALTLGVLVLDESFTVTKAIGFALILLGCIPATARSRAVVPEPLPEPMPAPGD